MTFTIPVHFRTVSVRGHGGRGLHCGKIVSPAYIHQWGFGWPECPERFKDRSTSCVWITCIKIGEYTGWPVQHSSVGCFKNSVLWRIYRPLSLLLGLLWYHCFLSSFFLRNSFLWSPQLLRPLCVLPLFYFFVVVVVKCIKHQHIAWHGGNTQQTVVFIKVPGWSRNDIHFPPHLSLEASER